MTIVNKHILLEIDEVMEVIIESQDINLKLQNIVFGFTNKYGFHINLKRDTLVTSFREYLDTHFMDEDLQDILQDFKFKPDIIFSGLSIIAASFDGILASQFDAFEYSVGLTLAVTAGIYFRHHSVKIPETYKLN